MALISKTPQQNEDWASKIFRKLKGKHYPISAQLELTERCNLNCVHCYINQPASDPVIRAGEMSTAEVKTVLDKMSAAGTLFLVLTGGEPLLRPDFPEIYQYAKRKGFFITLFTNATMLTEEIADLLNEQKPHIVDVTMYGASKATYEKVTRVPGSFERFMRGMNLLLERDLRVYLKTVVLTLNKGESEDIRGFAQKNGLRFRFDDVIWPRLDAGRGPLQYQIPLEEVVAIDLNDAERDQEWCRIAETFNGKTLRSEYLFSCGAGLNSYHVDPRGKMSVCGMLREPAFDLLQGDFNQIWEQFDQIRRKKRVLDTPCRHCEVGAYCTICPALSQAMHGHPEAVVDFVCTLAHLRADMLEYKIEEGLLSGR